MKERQAERLNARGRAYGDLIREYRKRKGMSQEQLGAIANVKKNAVGAWEAGRSRPDVASIPDLCLALDMPLQVFFGLEEVSPNSEMAIRFNRLNDYNQQVVLKQMDMLYEMQRPSRLGRTLRKVYRNDLSASAGPVSYIGEDSGETIYLIEDRVTSRADEIIRVSGDSMEPTFHDGDQVLVQHADRVAEGEIGIFLDGDAGYIKEYHPDGLYSHNVRYPVIRFASDDPVRCVGRVIGTLRSEQIASPEEIAAWLGGKMV